MRPKIEGTLDIKLQDLLFGWILKIINKKNL
jgi:hypothetical protein